MTPDTLQHIGQTLYGTHWQSELARNLNIDSRRIRQWLRNERPIPDWLSNELKQLLQKKADECLSALKSV